MSLIENVFENKISLFISQGRKRGTLSKTYKIRSNAQRRRRIGKCTFPYSKKKRISSHRSAICTQLHVSTISE